ETLTSLGVTVPGPRFVLPLPPVPRTRPIHNLGAAERISSGKTVVLHPGAGARRKRWSAERFAALAERFGARGDAVFLTSGPADEAAVVAVQEHARGVGIEVLRDCRLIELATVLRRADLFVGNDSGVTHLASILGVPTVALFGPFDPAYWMPIGPYVKVIDAGIGCPHRDDPREGCRQCDLLGDISVDMVWDAAPSVCQKMVLF
ncbi:MAG: glycosyltransferase family 9 protein, partial [Chloroflexi bacterium]|nr:glycosyltransferase family 9 protein [Chloroflexota bacterium]